MATVVAFIDARIGDPAAIVDRLPPDADWYVLAADDDGIGQMRRILAGYSDLAAIHVVSHGGEGVLYLGSTTLDSGSLTAYAAALADVGAALSEDGDLLLYGCDVGRGAVGAAFIDALAGSTGADVAASSDATGSSALGGNWALEVATGPIEAATLRGADFGALLAASVAITPQQAFKPEGNAASTFFTFALIRSGDVSTVQTVDWAVTGTGAHPAGAADFAGTLPSGTVTFGIGEINKLLTVSVSGDTGVEFDEDFTVTLSNASVGLIIVNGTASGAIQNDDKSAVSIAALSADKAEGNGGTTPFTFIVSVDQAGVAEQTVGWTVAGSGAHPADAADFGGSLPSGTVTFPAGGTSQMVTVLVSGDTAVEFDEGFAVTLSDPSTGLMIGTSSAAGIIDNDDVPAISIASQSTGKAEGDAGKTSFSFMASLDRPGIATQTIDWSVTGSGAHPADGVDFGGVLPAGTMTFAAGETDKLVTVSVVGDLSTEFDEIFLVTLSNASAGLVLGTASAAGTIVNDDVPVVSIAALSAGMAEGDAGTTSFGFTLSLDRPGVTEQTVDWSAAGSGVDPADAMDFGGALPAGTVTFAAGETAKLVTVLVSGDMWNEPDEKFSVTLSNASAGLALGTTSATGTIITDDFPPRLTIAALSADKAEGDVGTTSFTFTVSLDRPDLANQTVDWSVTGAGAQPADGADFGGALPAGTLTFVAGETSRTVTVLVSGDMAVEHDEAFVVVLTNPSSGLTIDIASATASVRNDDMSVVSIGPVAVVRATSQADNTRFGEATVSLDQAPVEEQSVQWTMAGSGANPASADDFVAGQFPAGLVAFAPAETSKTISFEISDDSTVEPDETFTIQLSNPSSGLTIGTATAEGTIVDDDVAIVSIAALSAVKGEGNAGTTPFTFTVNLDQPSVTDQTVDWSVTGTLHEDYTIDFNGELVGTVTFAAGETSTIVTVLVSGDTTFECDEDFTVTLSNASAGLLIANGSVNGTIQNDDTTTVSISALSAAKPEGNGGPTSFTFRVEALDPGCDDKVLSWSLAGSGVNGADAADFGGTLPAGTLTFAAGETSKTITVDVAGDTLVEADEAFTVTLSNPPSGLTIGTAAATGTILNDDAAVSIAAADATKAEGDSGTTLFIFTVTVTTDLGDTSTHEVGYWMAGVGPAPADASDFVGGLLPSGTLTFAAGETSKSILVAVAGDTAVEPDQGFTVTLSNPSPGLMLGTASAGGTIRNDDWKVMSSWVEDVGDTVILARAVDPDNLPGDWSTTAHFTIIAGNDDGLFEIDATGGISLVAGKALDYETSPSHVLTAGLIDHDGNSVLGSVLVTINIVDAIDVDEPFLALAPAAIEDLARAEGNAGTTAFHYVVTLWGDVDFLPPIVWSVTGSGDHAAAASDFAGGVLPGGTVTFVPGETSKTITVEVLGDSLAEFDESFKVTLSSPPQGLALGSASAEGTILDDDGLISISAMDVAVVEGNDGTREAVFQFQLSRPSPETLTFTYATEDGTANAGSDYQATGGALTFLPGQTTASLSVTIISDPIDEQDETFAVVVGAPSGFGEEIDRWKCTILNDDATVSIVATGATKTEGDDGTTLFDFSIVLAHPVSIDVADPGGNRTVFDLRVTGAGPNPADASDFAGGVLPSSTVTFAPGETSKTIAIGVMGDRVVEADEGFVVSLSNPSPGLTIGTASATATIRNDDVAVSIAATDATKAEGNSGATLFSFSVTVTTDVGDTSTHEVGYRVIGTGDNPAGASDFAGGMLPSGTLTFAAGETSKTVTVLVTGDTLVEADEAFAMVNHDYSGDLQFGGYAQATATIVNDDKSKVSIAAVGSPTCIDPDQDGFTETCYIIVALD